MMGKVKWFFYNGSAWLIAVVILTGCGSSSYLEKMDKPVMVGKMISPSYSFEQINDRYVSEVEISNMYESSNYTSGNYRITNWSSTSGIDPFMKKADELDVFLRVNYFYEYVFESMGGTSYDVTYWVDVYAE